MRKAEKDEVCKSNARHHRIAQPAVESQIIFASWFDHRYLSWTLLSAGDTCLPDHLQWGAVRGMVSVCIRPQACASLSPSRCPPNQLVLSPQRGSLMSLCEPQVLVFCRSYILYLTVKTCILDKKSTLDLYKAGQCVKVVPCAMCQALREQLGTISGFLWWHPWLCKVTCCGLSAR